MNIDIKCEYEQLVPVKDLKPNPKNPNKRPAAQADELAFLIKAHGWRVPIIVSTRSGMIVAGHGRLMAAKLLEMESVPVDYQDFESDELEYAFLTSDNAISEWSAIDRAMVNEALPDLGPDFDIRLLGLENFTLDVSEKDEKKTKDENSEEPPEEPEKLFGQIQIFNGDSAEVLRNLGDSSVDSIVTDPPYGFAFMGKAWDYELPSPEIWKECFRVLKPGGHLLAFGGPRTYHRLACGVEDAGFEIRDQIQWLFGSGFPKSLDISKAIDKAAGVERDEVGRAHVGSGNRQSKSVYGEYDSPGTAGVAVTAPATDAAKTWEGWGTALKPANEPIVLARKPLSEKTVAANVLKWGTGGLNIDGTRVGTETITVRGGGALTVDGIRTFFPTNQVNQVNQGRFPANLILDEEAARLLDLQVKETMPGMHNAGNKTLGTPQKTPGSMFMAGTDGAPVTVYNDPVSASRFFFIAKGVERAIQSECEVTRVRCAERASEILNLIEKEAETYFVPSHATLVTDLVSRFLSAKSAGEFVDCIETDFVLEAVKIKNKSDPNLKASRASIQDFKSFIPLRSLALLAVNQESIVITETIQSLLRLCGFVLRVTDENTNSENQSEGSAPYRFLYQAKASKSERNEHVDSEPQTTDDGRNTPIDNPYLRGETERRNTHPTVKPVSLMRYLCKLVTPPNGIVLDPFMGSGSTGVGALQAQFKFIGIEREPEYFEICKKRLNHNANQTNLIG